MEWRRWAPLRSRPSRWRCSAFPVPGAPQFPGPGGPVAFLIVGVVYAGLALLFSVVSFGVFTRRRWAWTGALTANALTLVLTIMRPIAAGHRTPDVVPLLLLTFSGLVILLSRHGRTALRPSREPR